MSTSRYWRIHYGPEYINNEAYIRATIINKILRTLVDKIGGARSEAHVCDSAGCTCNGYEGYACYHVVAMLDAGSVMTEGGLRELLLAECPKRNKNITQQCDVKPISALEYSRLV